MVNDVLDIEQMHIFEELPEDGGFLIFQLNKQKHTMRLTSSMLISCLSSKKAGCSLTMFQICSSELKFAGSFSSS